MSIRASTWATTASALPGAAFCPPVLCSSLPVAVAWPIAAALGVGWMLDAFEVQIIGSVIPSIAAEFGLSQREQIAVFVIWFVGIMLGALGFGYLADRFGRRRMFVITLVMYSIAAVCTAFAPN
jgi:MFS family permease